MMSDIVINTESHYTINKKRIRETLVEALKKQGVAGKVEVVVSVVGDRLMKKLNRQYRNLDEASPVLSFPLASNTDNRFVDPPDGVLHLGDIVVSYPQAREIASEEEKLVDDAIDELVTHGLRCLLGTV